MDRQERMDLLESRIANASSEMAEEVKGSPKYNYLAAKISASRDELKWLRGSGEELPYLVVYISDSTDTVEVCTSDLYYNEGQKVVRANDNDTGEVLQTVDMRDWKDLAPLLQAAAIESRDDPWGPLKWAFRKIRQQFEARWGTPSSPEDIQEYYANLSDWEK